MWDRPKGGLAVSEKTYELIHKQQPQAMIGNNHHLKPFEGEDFQMFEKDLPGQNTAGFRRGRTNRGNCRWKPATRLAVPGATTRPISAIRASKELVHYLVRAAGYGANFLLNVGPMPTGKIQPEFVERIQGIGEWTKRNGASVYGTRGGPVTPRPWGVTTQTKDKVYVHVLDWSDELLALPELGNVQEREAVDQRAAGGDEQDGRRRGAGVAEGGARSDRYHRGAGKGLSVIEFRLRENAGLRRFSYPVRAGFSSDRPAASLRLLENGSPVPAQFTSSGAGRVEVDFNASMLPWEKRAYRIEEGSGVAPKDTMTVVETGVSFVVKHPSALEFEVPKNLLGFLEAVRMRGTTWMRPGSFGLGLTYGDGIRFRGGGVNHWGAETKGRVVKQGPLACALQFDGKEGLRGSREVASEVEMQFPRSKSWVEVTWTIADPDNFVSGMSAEVNLAIEGPRTLVDFGAGSAVYAALRPGQQAVLRGRYLRDHATSEGDTSEWSVDVGGEPYASGRASVVEGWAHVMDSLRATAAAVADFGRSSAEGDRIEGQRTDG